jgi:hypothetical protein
MVELEDTYFRRFFVPIVVSILILCGALAIIVTAPGKSVAWPTGSTASMRGGMLKLLRRR